MEFNYNLFGYESHINNEPELVLIYGFAGLLAAMTVITLLSYIFRKIGFEIVVNYFFKPLLLAFGLCLFITLFPTMALYFIIPDLRGVKLAYIWITIFSGITIFSFVNYTTIKKFGHDIAKNSQKKEFRSRSRR
ncbi:hypothetical protein [Flavobacterium cerinum]|uniref:Uncharacterized protein n=1 Tax=Flavobacterium cerinum TaxID=2502784 RepID=A0A3S4SSX3_9FLAO|nr:hypothetical protein [Flavobacterium cerinum]RWW91671.1 hypothetical protein EPI11_18465 [Flavobacterium cerinum]